jgi:hypothetical protein
LEEEEGERETPWKKVYVQESKLKITMNLGL